MNVIKNERTGVEPKTEACDEGALFVMARLLYLFGDFRLRNKRTDRDPCFLNLMRVETVAEPQLMLSFTRSDMRRGPRGVP